MKVDNLELGTCIKNTERRVVSQNETCLKACGNMEGKICDKGCMASYASTLGMTLVKNSVVSDSCVDAVVINDGKNLTTLFYSHKPNEEDLIKERTRLISFGLSKSEITIFMLVMEGKKNSQIQKDLFISKATLKTHLNNIYKKLPEDYHQYKKRR